MMLYPVFCIFLGLLPSLGHSSPSKQPLNEAHLKQRSVEVNGCGKNIYENVSPDRVVGGRDAEPGEYPWQVSLFEGYGNTREREHVCGAAVLNDRWVLTAAHCIAYTQYRDLYQVVVGLHKLSNLRAKTVEIHEVEKFILHEKYNRSNFNNDIALIKTATLIEIADSNGYINGICLPKPGSEPTGHGTVAGWGHTKDLGRIKSDTLRTVDVPMVDRTKCNLAYDRNPDDEIDAVNTDMICAGSKGRDSCLYDSGGPLVQWSKSNVATVVGVVSFGKGCGLEYFPGVYTKVSSHLDWIERIIAQNTE